MRKTDFFLSRKDALKGIGRKLFFLLGGLLFTCLTGCSSSQQCAVTGIEAPSSIPLYAKPGTYKIGSPYVIKGIRYIPQERFEFEEIGLASWYGPGFHQKTTANMEIFDQHQISAAHKTLQLPCLVRVHNLDNNRVLDVRINDRGPFYDGRIIDLSKRAAQLLGVYQKGLARVHIKVLKEESQKLKEMALGKRPSGKIPPLMKAEEVDAKAIQPLPYIDPFMDEVFTSEHLLISGEDNFYIEIPPLKDYTEAAKVSAQMEKFGPSSIAQEKKGNAYLYKIQIGPLSGSQKTQKVLKEIIGKGFYKAHIMGTS